jgi:hypothetical protein
MSEPYLWPVLHPQIFDDRIVLVYPGGTVNAVYTIDEAKLAVKYMSKGKRKTDESFMARRLPLQQGITMLKGYDEVKLETNA